MDTSKKYATPMTSSRGNLNFKSSLLMLTSSIFWHFSASALEHDPTLQQPMPLHTFYEPTFLFYFWLLFVVCCSLVSWLKASIRRLVDNPTCEMKNMHTEEEKTNTYSGTMWLRSMVWFMIASRSAETLSLSFWFSFCYSFFCCFRF